MDILKACCENPQPEEILGPAALEARVYGLTLHRKYSENALVYAAERLALNEPLEPLDAEREFSQSHAPLRSEAPRAQTFE